MKKIYNVILNSNDSTDYVNGSNFYNLTYEIDLKHIIKNEDLKKQYKITWRLKSLVMDNSQYDPIFDLISLKMTINNTFYNSYNKSYSNILGFVSPKYEGHTNHLYSFDTVPSDNPPVYINSLYNNINQINIQFYNMTTNELFINMVKYALILSFEEL